MAMSARFISPMLLLKTDALPDDPVRWAYQLKLDGCRAIAFKTGSKVRKNYCNGNSRGRECASSAAS